MVRKIGLIAGNGRLPLVFAEAVSRQGVQIIAVGHEGETDPELASYVDRLHWVRLGQLGRILGIFRRESVGEAVMAGGITKAQMYRRARPDLRALSVLARLRDRQDDTLLRALAAELKREGIAVRGATRYLGPLLAPVGCLTRRRPTRGQERDLALGWEMARAVGRLGIGQTVVVRDCAVIAVEAMEGTDETIRRGAQLGNGPVVVVKVSKPTQDLRFDNPTVGPGTVKTLVDCGAAVLGVEAGQAIMLEREEMIRMADQAKLCLVGLQKGTFR